MLISRNNDKLWSQTVKCQDQKIPTREFLHPLRGEGVITPKLSYNTPRDSSPDTPLIAHSSYFGHLHTRDLPGLTPDLHPEVDSPTLPQLSSPRKLPDPNGRVQSWNCTEGRISYRPSGPNALFLSAVIVFLGRGCAVAGEKGIRFSIIKDELWTFASKRNECMRAPADHQNTGADFSFLFFSGCKLEYQCRCYIVQLLSPSSAAFRRGPPQSGTGNWQFPCVWILLLISA